LVGVVRSRTQATKFSLVCIIVAPSNKLTEVANLKRFSFFSKMTEDEVRVFVREMKNACIILVRKKT
jgi:hypothetical protein